MKHGQRWFVIALALVTLVAAAFALWGLPARAVQALGNTIYVDGDATGNNDGTSWEDAYTALQPALEEAAVGDEVWVAAATYTPSYLFDPVDPRSATFQLKNGVALYGGFDPTLGDVGWEDRDWVTNVAVLSGDIGIQGDPADNSYHVFYHPAELALDGSAGLDGFTVSGGNANCCSYPNNSGGAMYNNGSSPAVTHCIFSGNSADYLGGGMLNADYSSPVVTACTFLGNSASGYGGGMCNGWASPVVIDCTFSGNSAGSGGGGMANALSSPVVLNSTFSSNSASWGGGMFNESSSWPAVTNCILWGDSPDEVSGDANVTYSDIQGGYEGTGNINEDPLFVDPGGGDYHLGPGSPCIDAGTNDAPNLPEFDFEGDPRVMDGNRDGVAVVDIGVDEVYGYAVYLPTVFRAY